MATNPQPHFVPTSEKMGEQKIVKVKRSKSSLCCSISLILLIGSVITAGYLFRENISFCHPSFSCK